MKGKTISIPIKNITMEENEQYDLKKVSLKLLKDGAVASHGLYMDEECLSTIGNSVHLKPILCAYETDDEGNKSDFKGHEIEYQITRDGKTVTIKKIYIEQPVGVLENTNFQVQAINGENWVTCDGYLYKEYCEDSVRILEESDGEKAVSIEFTILDGYDGDDDLYHVTNIHFLGVTLLGESHTPAIDGANCVNFTQEQTVLFATQYSKIVDSVNKFNEIKGGKLMAKKKKKCSLCSIDFETDKEFLEGEAIQCENCVKLEFEKQEFAKSNQAIAVAIREVVSNYEVQITNRWGETYSRQKYYVEDVIIADNIVICEDNECYYAYYGIPFTMEGDKAVLDFENAKRYIKGDWRLYEGDVTEIPTNTIFAKDIEEVVEKLEAETKAKEGIELELKDIKVKFTDLSTDNEANVLELERLKAFEAKILEEAKEKEVDSVINEFTALKDVDGFDELIKDKMNLSKEDLENKLKVLAYDNGITLSKKANKKPAKESSLIKTNVNTFSNDDLTEAEKRYGVSVKRFLDK